MAEETASNKYDVAIVGLGPTGLTLAHLLGARGLSVLALEREPEFYGNARAVYTDDECMRVFQAARVADQLSADMVLDGPAQWVLGDGRVLAQFMPTARPYGWAASNFFYQPFLETKLEALLARYPHVTVRRRREVVGFEQDEAGIGIVHAASAGLRYGEGSQGAAPPRQTETVRARWLVGCDGGRSFVRTQLGIKMVGKSFPEPWLVVDIKAKEGEDCFRHLPYFNFYCDPRTPAVSCPQPRGHHRFEFKLMPGQTKEYMEDPATVRMFLGRHIDVEKIEILRRRVYTFNALMAERWRDGRVLLAGDAAHMTPQFMGQGMSSGVRDAYNLAWKLDAVLRGQASERLIDSYESERKPHAQEMIDVSVRMKNFVSQSHPAKAALRNLVVRTMLATPKLGDYIREVRFKPPPTYPQGSYLGLPRKGRKGAEGRPIPQPWVRSFDGRRMLFDELLGEGFALMGYGADPRAGLDPTSVAALDALGTRFVALYPLGRRPQGHGAARSITPGLVEVEDISGEGIAWLRETGARPGYVAFIRPDKFVYALASEGEIAGAAQHLLRTMDRPGATRPTLSTRHELQPPVYA
ncbi:MAG: bifunctional 3-(3-hydroxy-phenyl)propionate/3-hydroxycinnamic acid hydroxylase [Stellaceae bacterium]